MICRDVRWAACMILLTEFLSGEACAQFFTFERDPAGLIPVDDAPLTAAYPVPGGSMQMFFDLNGNNSFDPLIDALPVFEAAGPDGNDGFINTSLLANDTANAGFGARLGAFFLRQPTPLGGVPGPLIMDYLTFMELTDFAGEIWDIDASLTPGPALGFEQWQVDILNSAGTVLATTTSPPGIDQLTPLDGLPWTFSIPNLPIGAKKVRFSYVGSKADGVGLAFNNMNGLLAPPRPGSMITFETDPLGFVPIDDAPLTGVYAVNGGTAAFFFDVNGNNQYDPLIDVLPVFEATGADGADGFVNTGLLVNDTANAGFGAQLGAFFLRQPASLGGVPGPLIIDYQTCLDMATFAGEIWDIDASLTPGPALGFEQWQVDVLTAANVVLASLTSPAGIDQLTPLDGLPWNFSFASLPSGANKVRISYIGSKADGVGLAFNNFAATFVPPPGLADFNLDCVVDGTDFLIWLNNVGMTGTAFRQNGDANLDGNVGFADLALWMGQFGSSRSMLTAVPEPQTAVIVLMGIVAGAISRAAKRASRAGSKGIVGIGSVID